MIIDNSALQLRNSTETEIVRAPRRVFACAELMNGSVFIFGNNLLCHEKSIEWRDIVTRQGARVQFQMDNGRTTPDYKRQCE